MDRVRWFAEVHAHYNIILEHAAAVCEPNGSASVVLDIDETLVWHPVQNTIICEPIPGAVNFVNELRKKYTIQLVTGRIDSGKRRSETVEDLKDFSYDSLHLRPRNEPHSAFKLRMKTEINPVFSVGDQLTDHPDFLIPNPYYYINSDGDEVYFTEAPAP